MPGSWPDLRGLDATRFDPRRSPVLHRELPGLERAFNGETVRAPFQRALLGGDHGTHEIAECRPRQVSYLPGVCCVLRYDVDIRERSGLRSLRTLINGRVHPSIDASSTYHDERLLPLAQGARSRDELAPFLDPVAQIDELGATASVFPVDGELPTLLAATDPEAMLEILREALSDAGARRFHPTRCDVQLGHYGRQHRCVLKYHLEGSPDRSEDRDFRLVYGKIAADGRGVLTAPVIQGLNERVLSGPEPLFLIPATFGYFPELQLVLLQSIPGVPRVAQLLAARLKRQGSADGEPPTLEDAIDTCARIAAALHASGIEVGRRRGMDDELANLTQDIEAVGRVTPELGALLAPRLDALIALAADTEPLPLCLSHGDFKYTQLIFEGNGAGLVDFDTMCQAEPALDLGQFTAYIRVAALKALKAASTQATATSDALCGRFLDAYVEARGQGGAARQELEERARMYELVSLFRLAYHSWQKFKASRLAYVIPIIQERLSMVREQTI
jgi:hypothetical protein